MPTITFKPQTIVVDVEPNTKLLVAANRNKVPIRFGCASCRCGTCGVAVTGSSADSLSPMRGDERALLERMGLPLDGTVRLACQTRAMTGEIAVDLDFQNTYSPDDMDDVEDEDGEDEGDGGEDDEDDEDASA
jgi:ferredoxin